MNAHIAHWHSDVLSGGVSSSLVITAAVGAVALALPAAHQSTGEAGAGAAQDSKRLVRTALLLNITASSLSKNQNQQDHSAGSPQTMTVRQLYAQYSTTTAPRHHLTTTSFKIQCQVSSNAELCQGKI